MHCGQPVQPVINPVYPPFNPYPQPYIGDPITPPYPITCRTGGLMGADSSLAGARGGDINALATGLH
jgi:hypothetical protein